MNSGKIGSSADTQRRRAFDRVIEALSDSSLDHVRSSTWDGASDLLGYYNRLCGTVQEAMTGGDGEVVSAGPGSDEAALPTFDSVPLVTVDEPVEGSGIVDVLDSPIEATSTMFSSRAAIRSEAHTSELQSLMRISYAVFCLKKKTTKQRKLYKY